MGKLISYYAITYDDIADFEKEVFPIIKDNIRDIWDAAAYDGDETANSLSENIKSALFGYFEKRIDKLTSDIYSGTVAYQCHQFILTDFKRIVGEFFKRKFMAT